MEAGRLGFALQLTTARCVGRFLPHSLDVPVKVVDHLAAPPMPRPTTTLAPGRPGHVAEC
ncbi:DUF4158 domain-containing protein [Actinomadura miaoliensis]|uniref:DUF4158 domain-containing protein n=1 Tax=Actinomadura miaoliensis TaxID=430685 RepID=UPI003CD079BC